MATSPGAKKKRKTKNHLENNLQKRFSSVNKSWEIIDLEAADRNVWRRIAALSADMHERT